MLPTSDQIATAVIIGAWRLGEDPLKVADGALQSSRARWHAFAGLLAALADSDREYAAQGCGFEHGKPSRLAYRNLKANVGRMKWYEPAVVREIAAAVMAIPIAPKAADGICEVDVSRAPILRTALASEVMPAAQSSRQQPEMRPADAPPKSGRVSFNTRRSVFPSAIAPRAERATEPNPNRFTGFADERPRVAPEQATKGDLARMLAEAVKNTAKLQEKVR